MNTYISRTLIRLIAGPVAAAGILSGALGMAAVANASTHIAHQPQTQSGAHDNTQGAVHPIHIKVDPHAAAKITNLQEATAS
ncbi:hypothetical protein [Mycolicibacterium sp. 120270]|uniref:hypothetical protein n=1 Tax=Mycolicibacterium sp. 120270 TaxID=3090600 RepID=UPI00299E57D6|nr:hypothetical protein [Mycolicibacterium sp. 120270]MDX1884785.1 hypothetical protein [Mycolicibacterium sp. 120270]